MEVNVLGSSKLGGKLLGCGVHTVSSLAAARHAQTAPLLRLQHLPQNKHGLHANPSPPAARHRDFSTVNLRSANPIQVLFMVFVLANGSVFRQDAAGRVC